jgi:hypothetical protein
MGANSEAVLGSTLVPEDRNPTEFSIADMPGMFIWANNGPALKNKAHATIQPELTKRRLFLVMRLLTLRATRRNPEHGHADGGQLKGLPQ